MNRLLLDVRLFETETFLAVNDLQDETEHEGCQTEAGKHHQGRGVVVLSGVGDTGVGLVEHLADEQWEEPEADVLNPEDEGVG